MSNPGSRGGLSDAEVADLSSRVAQFQTAWRADGSTVPESFLPPPGARHRSSVLVELFRTDMERHARAGRPVRADAYLDRLPPDTVDEAAVTLIAEEYRLRHRYGDRPSLAEYESRFPAVVAELRAVLFPPAAPGAPLAPADAADSLVLAEEELGDAGRSVASLLPADRLTMPTPAGVPPFARHPSIGDDILPADVGYRLVRRIGMGAFGEVFEALAPGGMRVALKRILRSADHPASQGETEALEVMKAMSHPFLLQTHAYWVFRDRLVIVMELADGSLAGEVERHKKEGRPGVPPEELVPFFGQAAEALDYLHGQRVSHRDVKPENLLLLKGYAKVADFGLARGHRHDETAVVAEVGTPLYMAPEVWRRNVNLHSDQYSLAATYVSARLGRPLFKAETLFDLCYQHVNDVPDLAPLPPEEQAVLHRALAKKPDERYPSCAAFARALADAVFPPPPPAVVRRRTALWVGLVIGLGAVGALLAKYSRDQEPVPPPPEWVPAGWSPAPGAATSVVDGRTLHARLVRTVAGEELVAILILPVRPADPPPFYMLRDKVTTRVFKAMWDAAARPDSAVSRYRQNLPKNAPDVVQRHLPDAWTKLPHDPEKPRTTFDATPVLGVNAVQAILAAEELGGRLPTYAQWLKAVGANGDDPDRPGPAGDEEKPGENVSFRPLALQLTTGPRPITDKTVDESVFGIRELVSNGYEWADGQDDASRTRLNERPSGGRILPVTGMTYEMRTVLTFTRIPDKAPGTPWWKTDDSIGFRVVLEPR